VAVGADDGGHAGLGGDFRIFADAADVGRLPQRPAGDSQGAGLGDQPLHQVARQHLSQAPAAVANQRGGGLTHDLQALRGHHAPVADRGNVKRNPHDAVRIVSAQVGPNQALRDNARLAISHADFFEERARETGECTGIDDWHEYSFDNEF
jgi:hypothetical protein